MKRWRLLFSVILFGGLPVVFSMVGCGDDDGSGGGTCGDYFRKYAACKEELDGIKMSPTQIQESIDECKLSTDPIKDCLLDCDTGASCIDFKSCNIRCKESF